MKLDRNTLKKLIVETLEEQPMGSEHTGTAFDDVTSGREQDQEVSIPENVPQYFKDIGKEIEERIISLKQAPSVLNSKTLTTEVAEIIEKDMLEVQGLVEQILSILEQSKTNLKK